MVTKLYGLSSEIDLHRFSEILFEIEDDSGFQKLLADCKQSRNLTQILKVFGENQIKIDQNTKQAFAVALSDSKNMMEKRYAFSIFSWENYLNNLLSSVGSETLDDFDDLFFKTESAANNRSVWYCGLETYFRNIAEKQKELYDEKHDKELPMDNSLVFYITETQGMFCVKLPNNPASSLNIKPALKEITRVYFYSLANQQKVYAPDTNKLKANMNNLLLQSIVDSAESEFLLEAFKQPTLSA